MPLSELYRLAKRRVDSTQDIEPTNDVFELVWQNGQITTTQGQSSRGKKDPTTTNSQSLPSHCLPSQTPKPARAGKFGPAVEEIPMSVPSEDVGLSHDDDDEDMIPWLSYQMDCPELLPELSGVTATPDQMSSHLSSKPLGMGFRLKTMSTSPSPSPGVINFSHFSRPTVKANARIGADLRLSERGSEAAARPDQIGGSVEKNMAVSSSVCSGNSIERASDAVKRKLRDADDSECHSEDAEEESFGGKKTGLPRASPGSKRSRASEVHNLSERRRRDRINEKMRALQELIPNCNKVDKASMLDEAIEYLKTLQLQVQIMSMGTGLCMPQMMMPHMHMPHFPPMGIGMGMGMGFGMGMTEMSGAAGFQGLHFPGPPMVGPGLQVYGLPSQAVSMPMPMPMQMPRPHLGPMMSGPFTKSNMAAENTETGQPTENKSSMNHTSGRCQETKESIERPASALNNAQLSDANNGKASLYHWK